MPRAAIIHRAGVIKPDELVAAEKLAQELLNNYCRAKHGNQAKLVRDTGLLGATLSRMANGHIQINLESALLIDVATGGALPAEKLCPSRAELMTQFLALRTAGEPE